MLTWQQRCSGLEEQLSAMHHAQAEQPGEECMPGAELLQEGCAGDEALFPLHKYVSPGALKGALLGASAKWQQVTAPIARAACQAAWAAGCAPTVHEIQLSEPHLNRHGFHSLAWPQDRTLSAAQELFSGTARNPESNVWPQVSFGMPCAKQQQQWEGASLDNPNPCRSHDGSSQPSVGRRGTALQREERDAEGDAHVSLLLQALEAAVAPPGPSPVQHQQPQAAALHAQEEDECGHAEPELVQAPSVALVPRWVLFLVLLCVLTCS